VNLGYGFSLLNSVISTSGVELNAKSSESSSSYSYLFIGNVAFRILPKSIGVFRSSKLKWNLGAVTLYGLRDIITNF
jgi:hypothetical protein